MIATQKCVGLRLGRSASTTATTAAATSKTAADDPPATTTTSRRSRVRPSPPSDCPPPPSHRQRRRRSSSPIPCQMRLEGRRRAGGSPPPLHPLRSRSRRRGRRGRRRGRHVFAGRGGRHQGCPGKGGAVHPCCAVKSTRGDRRVGGGTAGGDNPGRVSRGRRRRMEGGEGTLTATPPPSRSRICPPSSSLAVALPNCRRRLRR